MLKLLHEDYKTNDSVQAKIDNDVYITVKGMVNECISNKYNSLHLCTSQLL